MPPIPININAPIKPDGVTPKTTADAPPNNPPPTRTVPASVPATTTASGDDYSAPPPPQPGARPFAPTANATQPTGSSNGAPPPPQPGATPFSSSVSASAPTASPPAPQITAAPTYPTHPPSQLAIPAPTGNHAPTHTTRTTTAPSAGLTGGPGPTTLPLGPAGLASAAAPSPYQAPASADVEPTTAVRHSLEHPPHYAQNPYAPDGTAADRRRLEDAAAQQRQEEGVAGTVMGALWRAGEAVAKAEEGVWGWVNRKA